MKTYLVILDGAALQGKGTVMRLMRSRIGVTKTRLILSA